MNRRRFLTLAAAFAGAPGMGQASVWRGQALGANVSVTLHGPSALTGPALKRIPKTLKQLEALFSLYLPSSTLCALNNDGWVAMPDVFDRLVQKCSEAHRLTHGLFDPTVQPLWLANAHGSDPLPAHASIGWDRLRHEGPVLRLGARQALTFNGIAQGFATDLIRADLAQLGATQALVNIGEYAGLGGPWQLAVTDPDYGRIATRTLNNTAIATSSISAMKLATGRHILAPDGRPTLWSTISIEARTATHADALSTAAVFMSGEELATLKRHANLIRITAVDSKGDVATF